MSNSFDDSSFSQSVTTASACDDTTKASTPSSSPEYTKEVKDVPMPLPPALVEIFAEPLLKASESEDVEEPLLPAETRIAPVPGKLALPPAPPLLSRTSEGSVDGEETKQQDEVEHADQDRISLQWEVIEPEEAQPASPPIIFEDSSRASSSSITSYYDVCLNAVEGNAPLSSVDKARVTKFKAFLQKSRQQNSPKGFNTTATTTTTEALPDRLPDVTITMPSIIKVEEEPSVGDTFVSLFVLVFFFVALWLLHNVTPSAFANNSATP